MFAALRKRVITGMDKLNEAWEKEDSFFHKGRHKRPRTISIAVRTMAVRQKASTIYFDCGFISHTRNKPIARCRAISSARDSDLGVVLQSNTPLSKTERRQRRDMCPFLGQDQEIMRFKQGSNLTTSYELMTIAANSRRLRSLRTVPETSHIHIAVEV